MSQLWKRGRTYYSNFVHGGKRIRVKLSTNRSIATKMLNELRARYDKADFGGGAIDNDYPWSELVKRFMAAARQTKKPSTVAGYEADLAKWDEYHKITNVKDIVDDLVFGFREWRQADGACPRTINKQVGTLQNVLNWGAGRRKQSRNGQRLIATNPVAGVAPLPHTSPVKQRRSLSTDEVLAIFEHSPEWLKPVWRMFCTTGIRRGELVGLMFSDIDWDNGTVEVRAENAKSKKARSIPLDSEMLAILRQLQEQAPRRKANYRTKGNRVSHEHVFVNAANSPYRNAGNLLRSFYAVCRRAGIEGAEPGGSVDLHSLRVSFATLAMENGASPKGVQAILGHSTLGLTMKIYAKATESSKRRAVDALPYASSQCPEHVIAFEKPRIGACG